MPDPYQVLGVREGASRTEIARGYRQAMLRAHPDHGGTRAEFDLVHGAHAWLMATVDATSSPAGQAPATSDIESSPSAGTPWDRAPLGTAGGGGLKRGVAGPRRGLPVAERRRWWAR